MLKNETIILSHSGGLDSSTLLYYYLDKGYAVQTVNFHYGQINAVEQHCAKMIIADALEKYGSELVLAPIVIDVTNIAIHSQDEIFKKTGSYYFPYRNQLFSTILLNIGESIKITKEINVTLALGIHKHLTYDDYWDITSKFVDKLKALNDLNPNKVEIDMPFVNFIKSQIKEESTRLAVPFEKTWTCYNPIITNNVQDSYVVGKIYTPCNECDACIERGADMNKYSVLIEDGNV